MDETFFLSSFPGLISSFSKELLSSNIVLKMFWKKYLVSCLNLKKKGKNNKWISRYETHQVLLYIIMNTFLQSKKIKVWVDSSGICCLQRDKTYYTHKDKQKKAGSNCNGDDVLPYFVLKLIKTTLWTHYKTVNTSSILLQLCRTLKRN